MQIIKLDATDSTNDHLRQMLLANEDNLREVVAFPMNQQAEDLMLGAPNKASENHLKELGILIKKA